MSENAQTPGIGLISENPSDVRFVEELGRALGVPVEIEPRAGRTLERLARGELAMLFVDIEREETGVALRRSFADVEIARRIHLISSMESASCALSAAFEPFVGHLLLRNFSDPARDARNYARILRAHRLGSEGTRLRAALDEHAELTRVPIHRSDEKLAACEAIAERLRAYRCPEQIAQAVASAADELLLNAIIDAQIRRTGHARTPGPPDSQPLEGKRAVEVHLGLDADSIGVSITDYAGSLEPIAVFRHVVETWARQRNLGEFPRSVGAGLGLALILRSGGSLYFWTVPGQRTEVIALFRRARTYREFRQQFRFISSQSAEI